MSVTYGFYNSLNGDRKYNTRQISHMFDGLILDGVYMSIGTSLMVTEGTDMTVNVGVGRAWFDHTWTLNDAILPLTLDQSDVILDRVDAIILEVNETEEIRANSIKIVKGSASSVPVKPILISTSEIHQYPLCYISIKAGATSIRQADIENMVGSEETPFVANLLGAFNSEAIIAQWLSWFTDYQENAEESYEAFLITLDRWEANAELDWDNWFAGIQGQLSEDAAANLYGMITDLKTQYVDRALLRSAQVNMTLEETAWVQNIEKNYYEYLIYHEAITPSSVVDIVFADADQGKYSFYALMPNTGVITLWSEEVPDANVIVLMTVYNVEAI